MIFSRFVVPSLLAGFALSFAERARAADTVLSADVDYAVPVDEPGADSGAGGQLRFGPRLDLALLTLDAELGLGAHALGGSDGPTAFRGVVGPRLGLDFFIHPTVFAHVGAGHLERSLGVDRTSLTADVGLAFEMKLSSIVDLGVHAAYNSLLGDGNVPGFDYVVLGGHLSFFLDDRDDEEDED